MKYYFRLLWLWLTYRQRGHCPKTGPCETPLRVMPNDLDLFGHVNNGAYLTLMDLARMDLMMRSGLFNPVFKNGWYPIVASETIRFYSSLTLFQPFTITTTLVGWDDKSIFLQQDFKARNKLIATAVVNARFLAKPDQTNPSRSIPTQEFLEFIDFEGQQPELPDWITKWHKSTLLMSPAP